MAELVADYAAETALEEAVCPPPAWYTDANLYQLERYAIFGRGWQCVGPASVVAEPGQFLTADLGGEPVAVIRGEDGRLRALSNVCRHRAAVLLTADAGRAETLRCPYHGWTYALDGVLRGAPEMETARGFDRATVALPELPVRVVGPLVWVSLDSPSEPSQPSQPREPSSSADWLTELGSHLAPLQLDRLHWVARRSYTVGCNWKVFVDNYLDGGYHVPRMHPGLFSVLDYGRYRTVLHEGWNVQISPMRPAASEAGSVRTGESAAYYWAFPNFMVNAYSGVMDTNRVEPLGVDRCAVVYDFFFIETGTPAAEKFIADSVRVAEQVQEEDRTVCESVQRGLGGRYAAAGRYCPRRENGQQQFHRLLAARLRAAIIAV